MEMCIIFNVKGQYKIMFSLFIVLLSFSESLARDRGKCLFLNDQPCMVIPTVIHMNLNEFEYYSFMITLNKFTGSCNTLSQKIRLPKKTKDINVKAFDMITSTDEAKAMTDHFYVIVNANSIVQHVIQNKMEE